MTNLLGIMEKSILFVQLSRIKKSLRNFFVSIVIGVSETWDTLCGWVWDSDIKGLTGWDSSSEFLQPQLKSGVILKWYSNVSTSWQKQYIYFAYKQSLGFITDHTF